MSSVSRTFDRLNLQPGIRARWAAADVRWEPPALVGLLAATALLYLWNLGASGWANSYYSAAVLAGTKSWTAFFFGSLDASNFITVDKTPASLWVMELSARIFGFNAWSVLAPQALEGMATVALVYAGVRRWSGAPAALLAGVVVALTPVAALMFRYNNPDALLVLLLTAAVYAGLRAVESGRTRWLLLAGAAVGLGFLAKELQALIVLPVLGAVYLLAGPAGLLKRLWQLAAAAAATTVAGGWWVAIVELMPAAARPYIGGSRNNDFLSVTFGYNGFGRLTGNETGSVGGGPVPGSMWGPTGWNRLFLDSFGGQVSWLIPGVLVLAGVALLLTVRRPRSDMLRASLLVWGGVLLVTGAVFSFAQGIIHPYYAVALAPPIGALVGQGASTLWSSRRLWLARGGLALALAVTSLWALELLDRSPDWIPPLRYVVLAGGLLAALLLLAIPASRGRWLAAAATAGLAASLAGPAAYTVQTVVNPHTGAIPFAGPLVAGQFGARGGPGGPFGAAAPGGALAPGAAPAAGGFGPTTGTGFVPGGGPGAGTGFTPGGGRGGGFLNASRPSSALVQLIKGGATGFTWAVATVDANSAAGYELATGEPVMAIGGFNGTDPAPTLDQFQQYVAQGKIRYFIAGGRGGPGGRDGSGASATAISQWVQQNFTSTTVGGVTVYDLTSPAG